MVVGHYQALSIARLIPAMLVMIMIFLNPGGAGPSILFSMQDSSIVSRELLDFVGKVTDPGPRKLHFPLPGLDVDGSEVKLNPLKMFNVERKFQ